MNHTNVQNVLPTTVPSTTVVPNKGGNGSRKNRNLKYRIQKNQETDDAIMAGIFARLKISDPTKLPSESISLETHPVTVPVSFKHIPDVVDRTWDTMQAIGTRPFAQLDTVENKHVFTKGMLILAEAKVCYAQRAHVVKPDEDLPDRKHYTDEELRDLNAMAGQLPYPLAILLETLGNTSNGKLTVTPLISKIAGNEQFSGAINYSPRVLLPLLRVLSGGVPVDGDVHGVAQQLTRLPFIEWTEFLGPDQAEGIAGIPMVRISNRCINFWLTGNNGMEQIKWTDDEYRIFIKIVQSMKSKKGFIIDTDLSHGMGSLAQTVQIPDYQLDATTPWYTMDDCPDYDVKLGAAFGFGDHSGSNVQPSRFIGSRTTAFYRGEVMPRRLLNAILAGYD